MKSTGIAVSDKKADENKKKCQQVNLEQEQVEEQVQQEEEEEVEQKEAPEYTTIVYQDKVGVGQSFKISR